MSTFAEMTEQVLSEISSYVRNQESLTVLTASITASDLTLNLDDATAISKGIVEIDDELVYLKRALPVDGTALVLPGGRGWRGTVAATHAIDAIVRNNPTFPKTHIHRAMNETLKAIDLYVIDSYEFTFDGSTYVYTLPADATDVTGITTETLDSSGRWAVVRHFRLDRNYWPTGSLVPRMAVELQESPTPGRIVRVQYLRPASTLSVGDEFSASGLPASCEDLIRLGAMWRLLSTIDPGKVVATSPSADVLDNPVPAGRPGEVSKYIYQLYSARLAEEKAKQSDDFLTVIHYQG